MIATPVHDCSPVLAAQPEPTTCYACQWGLRSHQHIGCDRDPARLAPRSIVKRPADHYHCSLCAAGIGHDESERV
jgi:hypothetical protein